jgi:hypothetical protein
MNRWLAFLVVLNCSIAISVESSLAGAVPAELYNKTGLGQWSTRFYSSIEQIGARINILARRVARSHGRLDRFHFGPSPSSITRQLPASS